MALRIDAIVSHYFGRPDFGSMFTARVPATIRASATTMNGICATGMLSPKTTTENMTPNRGMNGLNTATRDTGLCFSSDDHMLKAVADSMPRYASTPIAAGEHDPMPPPSMSPIIESANPPHTNCQPVSMSGSPLTP